MPKEVSQRVENRIDSQMATDRVASAVDIGLFEVADSPNLTFIFFIAMVLVTVLGFRFGYYAHRNLVRTEIATQRSIWRHLRGVGVFGGLYGTLGLLEVVTSLEPGWKNGALLVMTLLLVLSLRQINTTASGGTDDRGLSLAERTVRGTCVLAVVVYVLAVGLDGQGDLTAILQGVTALVFVALGVVYFRDQTARASLRGTMLDSLVRHLLPVLTFGACVSVVALAIPTGVDRVVVVHVQVVFLIMTATAMMTATIKLRQNVASLGSR
jgi:hypothetical protein